MKKNWEILHEYRTYKSKTMKKNIGIIENIKGYFKDTGEEDM